MSNLNYLQWPFFEAPHGDLAQALETWSKAHLSGPHNHDVDTECRNLVTAGPRKLAEIRRGRASLRRRQRHD